MVKKDERIEHAAWGLDDAVPSTINQAMDSRKRLFKKITRRLDRLTFLVLVSTVAQVALIYTIYTQL
ncbi:hypothetical protein N8344_01265 [bacterium]|nr:hypothetical protein [bacterium]